MPFERKATEIWKDSRSRARCRGCDALIEWATLVKSGKRMCFDEVFVYRTFEHASGRLIESVDLTRNHWARCPAADEFRQQR